MQLSALTPHPSCHRGKLVPWVLSASSKLTPFSSASLKVYPSVTAPARHSGAPLILSPPGPSVPSVSTAPKTTPLSPEIYIAAAIQYSWFLPPTPISFPTVTTFSPDDISTSGALNGSPIRFAVSAIPASAKPASRASACIYSESIYLLFLID